MVVGGADGVGASVVVTRVVVLSVVVGASEMSDSCSMNTGNVFLFNTFLFNFYHFFQMENEEKHIQQKLNRSVKSFQYLGLLCFASAKNNPSIVKHIKLGSI